jgi:hypothetical protein
MNKTYPPGVRKQIELLLKYKGGRQMVKQYLAIINSPEYLGRSPKFCSARGGGRKKEEGKPTYYEYSKNAGL